MSRIILASKSPRRKKLLEQLGFTFEVYPGDTNENIPEKNPELLVKKLALLKAADVSENFPDSLIIGADTIVTQSGNILGKPTDANEAADFLKRLSNDVHEVYTGVAILKTDRNGKTEKEITFFEQTKVYFCPLSNREIEAYIKTGSPLDKAGAYGIQDDFGAVFVKKIEGDYYNVIGFPLNRFYQELKKFEPQLAQIRLNA